MHMDVDGSAAATRGRGDADSSWETWMDQQDQQEQLNEAHGQGPHPSRPRYQRDTMEWQEPCCSSKQRRENSSSGGRAGQSLYSFPLAGPDGRQKACDTLYKVAAGLRFTQSDWIYDLFHLYLSQRDVPNDKVASLSNEVLTMVNEFQLTSSVHHTNLVSPVVPDSLERWLRPLSYYTRQGTGGVESMDIREREITLTL